MDLNTVQWTPPDPEHRVPDITTTIMAQSTHNSTVNTPVVHINEDLEEFLRSEAPITVQTEAQQPISICDDIIPQSTIAPLKVITPSEPKQLTAVEQSLPNEADNRAHSRKSHLHNKIWKSRPIKATSNTPLPTIIIDPPHLAALPTANKNHNQINVQTILKPRKRPLSPLKASKPPYDLNTKITTVIRASNDPPTTEQSKRPRKPPSRMNL